MKRNMKTMTIILLAALLLTSVDETHGLTISGSTDASFRITFVVVYATTRQTKVLCRDYNPLAGVWSNRAKWYSYHVIVSKGGRYSIEVPFSEMEPGLCEWRPIQVVCSLTSTNSPEESAQSKSGLSLLLTEYAESRKKSEGLPVTHITLRCSFDREPYVCGFAPGIWSAITTDQKDLELNFVAGQ